jgi:hypothetical protein
VRLPSMNRDGDVIALLQDMHMLGISEAI